MAIGKEAGTVRAANGVVIAGHVFGRRLLALRACGRGNVRTIHSLLDVTFVSPRIDETRACPAVGDLYPACQKRLTHDQQTNVVNIARTTVLCLRGSQNIAAENVREFFAKIVVGAIDLGVVIIAKPHQRILCMEGIDRIGLHILKLDFLDIRPCATKGDIA
ncbi:hypothetical protein D3C80_1551570 [compost metagenome]